MAFQLNMPTNKTIHKVENKTIYLRIKNQEKLRLSVLLSSYSNGWKIKALCYIYRGSKNE